MHSRSVERFLKKNGIAANYINIDGDPEARQTLMSINRGYASVPTIIFPDGTQLTEPSYRNLRDKLNIDESSLSERLKGLFG
jgi:mycoredoxin